MRGDDVGQKLHLSIENIYLNHIYLKMKSLQHSPFVVGIIFELIDLVKDRMVDFYPLITADIETGSAICKNVFSFSKEKEGNVGGLRVEEGELNKGRPTKVMRNGEEVYRDVTQSGIKSLRHVKEEQEIIPKGMECGLILDGGYAIFFSNRPYGVFITTAELKTLQIRKIVNHHGI